MELQRELAVRVDYSRLLVHLEVLAEVLHTGDPPGHREQRDVAEEQRLRVLAVEQDLKKTGDRTLSEVLALTSEEVP